MGSTSFGVPSEVESLIGELNHLLELCRLHLRHEDDHIHAALERRRPRSSAALAEEHERHLQAILELRSLGARLRGAGPEQAQVLGRALYLRFSTFVSENITHMAEEELVVQRLLEELYDDAELQQLHDALVADIAPDEMMSFLCIMVPALDRNGRFELLSMAAANAPPEAFAAILASVRPGLNVDDWSDLQARLAGAAE
jgi:hypothetical protein